MPAIAAIAREVPDAIVGAGTVRNAADARAAKEAGAARAWLDFIVSPQSAAVLRKHGLDPAGM